MRDRTDKKGEMDARGLKYSYGSDARESEIETMNVRDGFAREPATEA